MKQASILALIVLVALVVSPAPTVAHPIAIAGTEGLTVLVANTNPVVATYEGSTAGYVNDLYFMVDALGLPGDDGDTSNDVFLFSNASSTVGDAVTLGSFAPGTALQFRLFVNDTATSYFTGPGSRNPDDLPHARVDDEWIGGRTLVSFEDLGGLPEGADGYNDLSISLSNTATSVPEPAVLTMLTLALFVGARRLRRHA